MSFSPDQQNSGHKHNSTVVWTQPETDEQIAYYSKHAAEKRVFGWITTLLQTAHGAIAFAAWTAIYLWVFKNVPFLLFFAPWLAGGTLLALHILFRTTWQTFWYDKLDTDPNTDSPVAVPIAIILLLLFAEVQGARQYLAGQVAPASKQNTEQIDQYHQNAVASIEQAYRNEIANIDALYKAKTAPIDRQIASARNRSANTDEERRALRSRIAALQSQRDQVLTQKAGALEIALATATASRNSEVGRRERAVAEVDNHNAGELARYTADLGSVNTYAWVLSVVLLALIAGLSYRTVRINVKSGILPLRNYTVLDAHGSIAERLFTAFGDAINRRGLQVAVWIHRLLSPKQAITSFDGTVVAKPGTYNTPENFYPANFKPAEPIHLKTEREAAAEVLAKMAENPHVKLSSQQIAEEVRLSQRTNGDYKNMPLGKPDAPAQAPAPVGARPTPTPTYDQEVRFWAGMVQNQLAAYDKYIIAGEKGKADEISAHILTDPNSPILKEGRRLGLRWGVRDGEFVVGRTDRDHYVPLEKVTESALLSPISGSDDAPVDGEDENLFKYDLNKFKQEILAERDPVSGKVIGVKYKKADGGWGNIGLSQVRAFRTIYEKYNRKPEPGTRVREGLDKWNYALSLFDEGREVTEENIQTVSV